MSKDEKSALLKAVEAEIIAIPMSRRSSSCALRPRLNETAKYHYLFPKIMKTFQTKPLLWALVLGLSTLSLAAHAQTPTPKPDTVSIPAAEVRHVADEETPDLLFT